MPNWVTVRVSVTGPEAALTDLAMIATRGYYVAAGSAEKAAAAHSSLLDEGWYAKDTFSFGAITGVSLDFAHNWYEEGVELWGVKWDVHGSTDYGEEMTRERMLSSAKKGRIDLAFDTAWSFPLPALLALSKAAGPEVLVEATAVEEGDAFLAVLLARGGVAYPGPVYLDAVTWEGGSIEYADDEDRDEYYILRDNYLYDEVQRRRWTFSGMLPSEVEVEPYVPTPTPTYHAPVHSEECETCLAEVPFGEVCADGDCNGGNYSHCGSCRNPNDLADLKASFCSECTGAPVGRGRGSSGPGPEATTTVAPLVGVVMPEGNDESAGVEPAVVEPAAEAEPVEPAAEAEHITDPEHPAYLVGATQLLLLDI